MLKKFTNFTVLTVSLVMLSLLCTETWVSAGMYGEMKGTAFIWAVKAGRESVIYLNLPSNRISHDIPVPIQPAGVIVAKYSPETASGAIYLTKIRRTGGSIIARIQQLSPRRLANQVGADAAMWDYAWWAWDSSCGTPTAPPGDATLPDQARYNFLYMKDWQPVSACWKKIGLKDFYGGDNIFHNVSFTGFLKLTALAAYWNRAGLMYVAVSQLQRDVQQSTSGNVIRKKTTTTVTYYTRPRWLVGAVTWRKCADMNACGTSPGDKWIGPATPDFRINPWYEPWREARFEWVEGDLSDYPVQEKQIYQWSETKKSWGFAAVLLVGVVLAAVTAGAGAWLANMGYAAAVGGAEGGTLISTTTAAAVGGGIGALGELAAGHDFSSGYSIKGYTSDRVKKPTPSDDHERDLQNSVEQNWVKADPRHTGGGFQVFISYVDPTRETGGYTTLPMTDPKAQEIYQKYFHKPWKDSDFLAAIGGM